MQTVDNMLTIVVLYFVLLFTTYTSAQNQENDFNVETIDLETVVCPTLRCAPIGPPICARYGSKLTLFPTNCALLAFTCVSGQAWKPVSLKTCAKRICPVKCNSSQTIPVCASNQKQLKVFNSECEFRNYACRRFSQKWSRGLTCFTLHNI